MRFNDDTYLQEWQAEKKYPAIHDTIYKAYLEHCGGGTHRVLDLCCSTGLLGQHILDNGGSAIGVDCDPKAREVAKRYGISLPIYPLKIVQATLPLLSKVLKENPCQVVLARRCFPEISNGDWAWGQQFVRFLHEHGVDKIVIQGRLDKKTNTDMLGEVGKEVALVQTTGLYQCTFCEGQIAVLIKV